MTMKIQNNNLGTYNKMISDKETLNDSINATINLSVFFVDFSNEEDYLLKKISKNSFLTKLKFFIYKTRG